MYDPSGVIINSEFTIICSCGRDDNTYNYGVQRSTGNLNHLLFASRGSRSCVQTKNYQHTSYIYIYIYIYACIRYLFPYAYP